MVVTREIIVISREIDASSTVRFAALRDWRFARDASLLFSLRENVSVIGQVSATQRFHIVGLTGRPFLARSSTERMSPVANRVRALRISVSDTLTVLWQSAFLNSQD